jgi:ribose 5-phosphate isomerase B
MPNSLFVDEDRPKSGTAGAPLRIAVGGDHAGFLLKGPLIDLLLAWGHTVEDFGTNSVEPVDFPDIAHAVCSAVREGRAERGILVCGTGVGACIAANKHPAIRAAVCHDVYSAHQCVEHDNVNLLCLGAQIVGHKLAGDVLRAYLEARFVPDAHFVRRLGKLTDLERREAEWLVNGKGRPRPTRP